MRSVTRDASGIFLLFLFLSFSSISCRSVPNTAKAQFRAGVRAHQQGNYYRAIDRWKRTLALDPGYPDAHENLGTAYMIVGLPGHAIDHFSSSLKTNSDSVRLLAKRGKAYLGSGQYEEAIKDFNKVLQKRKQSHYALVNRGRSYLELNQLKNAEKDFRQSLSNQENPRGHFGLGLVQIQRENWQKAIRQFSKSIEQDPNLRKAYLYRAVAFREVGNEIQQYQNLHRYLEFSNPHLTSRELRSQISTTLNQ